MESNEIGSLVISAESADRSASNAGRLGPENHVVKTDMTELAGPATGCESNSLQP